MNIVTFFQELAHQWHTVRHQQVRKYTGEPYTNHTNTVAMLYAQSFPHDEVGIAAAHGHDLLEDTDIGIMEIFARGLEAGLDYHQLTEVVSTIIELTDVYTSEYFPEMRRAERKGNEAKRLWKASARAQNIKAFDLINNTQTIVPYDVGFARMYLPEKEFVLSGMKNMHPSVASKVWQVLDENLAKIR
jgi:(p)ppGpp synthase/HD superfamily hydrolase